MKAEDSFGSSGRAPDEQDFRGGSACSDAAPSAAVEERKLDRFLGMVRVWVEREGGDMDAMLAWMYANHAPPPVGAKVCRIPQGWKLVPVEPTPEMVRAIDAVMWPGASEKAYRAMLAAAPTPVAQPMNTSGASGSPSSESPAAR